MNGLLHKKEFDNFFPHVLPVILRVDPNLE
jgi:hypothetical protein